MNENKQLTDSEDPQPSDLQPEEPETEQPGKTPGRSGRALVSLLLLVLLVAMGAAAYYWATDIHAGDHTALTDRLAAMDAAEAEQGAAADALAQALAGQADTSAGVAGDIDALGREQAALAESVKALYARDAQASLAWVLAEAEYLVLAATQRLALEHDTITAAAAIRAADDRVRSAKHPDLISLREQFTSDVSALEAVKEPDIEGLALYLAQASADADNLPTRPIAELEAPFGSLPEESIAADNLGGIARALWADLKSLVEVKDGQLAEGVLFDPKLRYFLQQNLRLELASARLAVLRRDNDNFHAAVRLVRDLLETYYDRNDGAVRALLERLESSGSVDLDPAIPNISGSLDAIRTIRGRLAERAGAPAS